MKQFTTTGPCVPSENYMVNLQSRIEEIKKFVDEGKYFTINRARQYGKTTTIYELKKYLSHVYSVVSLDFQDISSAGFLTEGDFTKSLARLFLDAYEFEDVLIPEKYIARLEELDHEKADDIKMDELFRIFKRWCRESDKGIVLIIDEVDSATNNQAFLDFLAQLRSLYLKREQRPGASYIFQSVILAGVTDVKHLRSKIRDKDQHKVNSPWNIAADFNIDMSLSKTGIQKMLKEYAADHEIKMDTAAIAKQIREYTNGYPYLVSRICQKLDENMVPEKFGTLTDAWTEYGVDEAVKMILTEKSSLFESLTSKLSNYPKIRDILYRILIYGESIPFNIDQEEQNQMFMYGFIRDDRHTIAVSNRIFETRLYNLFLSDDEMKSNVFSRKGALEKNIFVEDSRLNLQRIMDHFIITFKEVFGPLGDKFKEEDGRKFFLLYLKPIINGTGNYYIEAQTRNQKRTDVIIDYLGQQYIIELKIWHGERYKVEGEKQISNYLDYFGLSVGYMLSFNFNKKKETGVRPVRVGDKLLYEGTV